MVWNGHAFRRFPAIKVRWGPALVQFDKIESRQALRLAVAKIRFPKQFPEPRTRRISPSGLLHEAVENFDFSFMGSPPVCEAPFENFLICPASQHAVLHFRIPEMQEGKTVAVELTSQILMMG